MVEEIILGAIALGLSALFVVQVVSLVTEKTVGELFADFL
jgi:hypothetical protein